MTTPLASLKLCPVLIATRQDGKQAIKGEHRKLFPQSIQHSIDFEQAASQWKVKGSLKRCDYLVQSQTQQNTWSAVEVHKARAGEVIQKKQDSAAILKRHCPSMLQAIQHWFVCVQGELHPAHKRKINDAGIQTVRNLLTKL